jgi:hypothetical protein
MAVTQELNGDRAAADIDRAGLQRMAELRGGLDKLGLDGLTSVLIKMLVVFSRDAANTDWRTDF